MDVNVSVQPNEQGKTPGAVELAVQALQAAQQQLGGTNAQVSGGTINMAAQEGGSMGPRAVPTAGATWDPTRSVFEGVQELGREVGVYTKTAGEILNDARESGREVTTNMTSIASEGRVKARTQAAAGFQSGKAYGHNLVERYEEMIGYLAGVTVGSSQAMLGAYIEAANLTWNIVTQGSKAAVGLWVDLAVTSLGVAATAAGRAGVEGQAPERQQITLTTPEGLAHARETGDHVIESAVDRIKHVASDVTTTAENAVTRIADSVQPVVNRVKSAYETGRHKVENAAGRVGRVAGHAQGQGGIGVGVHMEGGAKVPEGAGPAHVEVTREE